MAGIFTMIENYIYLHHTDTWIILPVYPETLSDTLQAEFSKTTPLLRTAPIWSYASSGPRSVRLTLPLHRDMMSQINYQKSNVKLSLTDDYVDIMIKQLQAIALPRYSASSKMVDPPMISVRIGNELFIKGIVDGGVSIDYGLPILENMKYALATVSFTVSEVDPYDANQVMRDGSMRGLNTTLERKLYKSSRIASTTKAGI